MDITKLTSTQIVSNVQLVVIVHQQRKQSLVRLDITKINQVKQHVTYVQLVQHVMVHQQVPVVFQNILLLEWPTVLVVLLVTFAPMSPVTVWPLVHLEHLSTAITVKNVRQGTNARHQFKARLLVLAMQFFVHMQVALEIPFVQFVQLDHDAPQRVQPAVTPVNIHWKVNETAILVQMVISVLRLT